MPFFDFVTQQEIFIRLGAFIGIFAIMASWEIARPCRPLSVKKSQRWFSNLGLVAVDNLVVRLVFPVAAVGVALWAESEQLGLFNQVALPVWLTLLLTVIMLDCLIYGQHVLFHAVPFFWNYHKVHHVDLDYDVTTGARFHPLEIVFSMAIKMFAIVLLGAPAVGVIIFEVLLNGTAMFNHANVTLPKGLDRFLRWVIVTPDMHRVHHSVEPDEHHRNFGFNLPWWDRLFRTYRPETRAGNLGMTVGLNNYRDPNLADKLWSMLLIPFKSEPTRYQED